MRLPHPIASLIVTLLLSALSTPPATAERAPSWLRSTYGSYVLIDANGGFCFPTAQFFEVGEAPRFSNYIFDHINDGWLASYLPTSNSTQRTYTSGRSKLVREVYYDAADMDYSYRSLTFSPDYNQVEHYYEMGHSSVVSTTSCVYERMTSTLTTPRMRVNVPVDPVLIQRIEERHRIRGK